VLDKFQAALIGYAIGDALAAPIEDTLPEPGTEGLLVTEYIKAPPAHPLAHLEPGQYSDETQNMILCAESLVTCKSFNIEDLAHRMVDWFHSQKLRSMWRFPGNTVMKACRKLAAGSSWSMAGVPSSGIGGCTRTVPVALLFWRTSVLLKDAVEKSCRLTHTDPKAVATAMILATVIRLGLEGAEPAPDAIFNAAIEKGQMYAPEIPKRMKLIKDALKLDFRPGLEMVGCSGFCFDAISAALLVFLRHPRRFDEMIIEAANASGDSDMIAAMAGAMFGAFYGMAPISDRWTKPLENVDKIKQLGNDLYRLATPHR
jgi:ADP-ribosylglycohydrolase